MGLSVLLIWFGYLFVFTLLPMLAAVAYGPHPVFYEADGNYWMQIISACFLLLGASVPVFIKMRLFRIRVSGRLIVIALRVLPVILAITHGLVYTEYGLDFRHHTRISSMGLLGYFYALEQVILVPFIFLMLRFAVCGAYEEINKSRFLLLLYGLVLFFFPFNVFNLLSGFLILTVLYFRSLFLIKVSITSTTALLGVSSMVTVGALYWIKGGYFEGFESVVRYLQYRISIWYVSAELLTNMSWDSRLSIFLQAWSDGDSINTRNAGLVFQATFINPRVGAGPGVIGAALYLTPFPVSLFLIAFYGFILSYLLKCSGLFRKNISVVLLGAVFCLLFPFLAAPIQYASFELMPLANLLIFVLFMTISLPRKYAFPNSAAGPVS